ncbi:MAG: hypothetical protein H7Y11_00005, partial [Armatimonadetes bacterium]|nr:hypothetical protein [Anaerolineae bacterium]
GGGAGYLARRGVGASVSVRLPSEVLDMEANSGGNVVVCGAFGVALIAPALDSVLWNNDTIGTVNRCAIDDNSISAALVQADKRVYVYDIGGTAQGDWDSGGGSRNLNDVAVYAPSQTVVMTGYNQAAADLQVAFMQARSYNGDAQWTAYDFSAGDVQAANLGADSRGERVAIGGDGALYFSGYVDGGNAIYGRSPQDVSVALSADQLIKTDAYNDPYNISGAKALGWYGRFDAATGILARGQFLLTRLSDGKGNSISIKALTASATGEIYISGEAYFSIEDRANRQVGGITVGDYAGGEPFVLVTSADLTQRLFWTPFAATGKSAGGSPAYGVGVGGGFAAVGGTLKLTEGQRTITVTPTQPNVGGGDSDGYLAYWAVDNLVLPDTPILVSPAAGSTVDTNAPLLVWLGPDADTFKVTVKDLDGVKLLNVTYNAVDVCLGENCQASPGADGWSLNNGDYVWRIKAQNSLGVTKSAKTPFTVNFPGSPELISPADAAAVTTTPTLEWSSVAAATEYTIV